MYALLIIAALYMIGYRLSMPFEYYTVVFLASVLVLRNIKRNIDIAIQKRNNFINSIISEINCESSKENEENK